MIRRIPCPSPRSVLDAWIKGSVLFNGAVYLEDTLNRRQSRWLTLDGAAKGDAKVLAGPTDDGWYHVQVGGGWAGGYPLWWVLRIVMEHDWSDCCASPASSPCPVPTPLSSPPLHPLPLVDQLCEAERRHGHQAHRRAVHVEQDLHPGQVG